MTASSKSMQAEGTLVSPAAAELLAKLIVVVAALFPVAGVAIRAIGFQVDPYLRNGMQLAVALPVVDLTALGAWNLLTQAPMLLFLVFVTGAAVRFEGRMKRVMAEGDEFTSEYQHLGADLHDLQSRLEHVEEEVAASDLTVPERDGAAQLAALQLQAQEVDAQRQEVQELDARMQEINARFGTWSTERAWAAPWWFRLTNRLLDPVARVALRLPHGVRIVAALLALAAFAAWLPLFPIGPVVVPTVFLGQMLLTRSIRAAGDFRLRHAWPGLAVIMVGYVIASGLTYVGPRPATYHFVSTAGVEDGSYAELGRTDELVYLRACTHLADGSIAVPVSAIRLIEFPPPVSRSLGPSLVQLLQGKHTLRLGAAGQCDVP
jgi:hypothetical protein